MTSGQGVDDLINALIKKKVLKKGLFDYGQDIVKKGLQKVVHGHPRTPSATPMNL